MAPNSGLAPGGLGRGVRGGGLGSASAAFGAERFFAAVGVRFLWHAARPQGSPLAPWPSGLRFTRGGRLRTGVVSSAGSRSQLPAAATFPRGARLRWFLGLNAVGRFAVLGLRHLSWCCAHDARQLDGVARPSSANPPTQRDRSSANSRPAPPRSALRARRPPTRRRDEAPPPPPQTWGGGSLGRSRPKRGRVISWENVRPTQGRPRPQPSAAPDSEVAGEAPQRARSAQSRRPKTAPSQLRRRRRSRRRARSAQSPQDRPSPQNAKISSIAARLD